MTVSQDKVIRRVDKETQNIDSEDKLIDHITQQLTDLDTASDTLQVINEREYIDTIIKSIPGVTLDSPSKCK